MYCIMILEINEMHILYEYVKLLLERFRLRVNTHYCHPPISLINGMAEESFLSFDISFSAL